MKRDRKRERRKPSLTLIVYIILRAIVIFTAILALLDGSYYVALLCALALFLFFLPSIIDRRFNIEVPSVLELIVILFIFSSVILGEIGGYYESYPHWDKMLHISSGFLSAAIGFSLIDILNRSEKIHIRLSPFFVAIFAFCFSMTIGVLWEFYEFSADSLFRMDMQKDRYVTSFNSTLLNDPNIMIDSVVINGENWEGYVDIGLIDTMEDLIVNAVGAFVFTIFGWLYLHGRSKWVEKLMPKRKEPKAQNGDGPKNEKKSE